MATINPTITRIDENTILFFYETLTATDVDGSPIAVQWADYADRMMQVFGTWGVGGGLRIEGSQNDGTNYATLNDNFGNAITFAADGLKGVVEIPLWTRPYVTGGDVTTDLDVYILARRARSGESI